MSNEDPPESPGDGPGDPEDPDFTEGPGASDDPQDPFAGLFGALGEMFGSGIPGTGGLPGLPGGFPTGGGTGGSDPARQIAMAVASEGGSEPNVDPVVRIGYESLLRVAELQIADRTGLQVAHAAALHLRPVTRTAWASASVDAYRPYLTRMSHIPGDVPGDPGDPGGPSDMGSSPHLDPSDQDADPSTAWLSGLLAAMAPMMAGITTGTMVGRLALRSLGTYDLPIPRDGDELLIVVPNVEAFATDWSLPAEDLRLWICLHEVAHHAVLGVPHLRTVLTDLLTRHAGAFRNDPSALRDRLGDIDLTGGPEALVRLQESLDPEMVLGAVRSPEQEALLPRLEALVAMVIGYVDHVMDDIGSTLIGSYRQVTEAVRRRRVGTGEADRFVERILGLDLTQEQVDRGAAFVDGVVERSGGEGLDRLWADERNLPTPAEVDAPGLWLARIDLPDVPDVP
ncbi:MAG: zinc-dependent metalloprotease [Acidimicrobiales bacterium]|nr:zinc-dependent metalloprotease [Acidimicrobiales bacterium]